LFFALRILIHRFLTNTLEAMRMHIC
jgi:hypothetical protein